MRARERAITRDLEATELVPEHFEARDLDGVVVRRALTEAGGVVQAARSLGIARTTLASRLEVLGARLSHSDAHTPQLWEQVAVVVAVVVGPSHSRVIGSAHASRGRSLSITVMCEVHEADVPLFDVPARVTAYVPAASVVALCPLNVHDARPSAPGLHEPAALVTLLAMTRTTWLPADSSHRRPHYRSRSPPALARSRCTSRWVPRGTRRHYCR